MSPCHPAAHQPQCQCRSLCLVPHTVLSPAPLTSFSPLYWSISLSISSLNQSLKSSQIIFPNQDEYVMTNVSKGELSKELAGVLTVGHEDSHLPWILDSFLRVSLRLSQSSFAVLLNGEKLLKKKLGDFSGNSQQKILLFLRTGAPENLGTKNQLHHTLTRHPKHLHDRQHLELFPTLK